MPAVDIISVKPVSSNFISVNFTVIIDYYTDSPMRNPRRDGKDLCQAVFSEYLFNCRCALIGCKVESGNGKVFNHR